MTNYDEYTKSEFTLKMEVVSKKPVYVGECMPGTLVSVAKWRIKKMTYNADGIITDIQWADGTRAFDKEWDKRATYTYS